MSITFDGHRSLRRKHMGQRVLNSIVELGLPAKAIEHDGFKIRALNFDDVKYARITAPAGALIACSQPGTIQVIESDHWLSSATSRADAYIANYTFSSGQTGVIYDNPNTAVVPNVLFEPEDTHSEPTAGLQNPPWSPTAYQNMPPQLGLMPYVGESYVLTLLGRDVTRKRTESLLTPYLLAGNSDKRIAIASEVDNSTLISLESIHALPGDPYRVVGTCTEDRRIDTAANKYIHGVIYEIAKTGLGHGFFYADTMCAGVQDATLRGRMTTVTTTDVTQILASYAFAIDKDEAPTLLSVVDARDASLHSGLTGTDAWKLFFSIYTYGAGSISTWSLASFAAVLNALDPSHLVGAWPSVDFDRAHDMLAQLIGWPMRRENLPPDTVTFHGASGEIYTWTRRYGSVQFSTTGLITTTLVMPPEVMDEDGVRPELSYAGDGLYLCVCNKPGKKKLPSEYADQAEADADWCGIKAVYTGSPLSGWTDIPMPDPMYRLHHVRPIVLSGTEVMLLGILRTLDTQPVYYLAVFKDSVWKTIGKLPVIVTNPEVVSWSTALFGNDPLVASMAAFIQPPAITPQMPALPYTVYAGVIP